MDLVEASDVVLPGAISCFDIFILCFYHLSLLLLLFFPLLASCGLINFLYSYHQSLSAIGLEYKDCSIILLLAAFPTLKKFNFINIYNFKLLSTFIFLLNMI